MKLVFAIILILVVIQPTLTRTTWSQATETTFTLGWAAALLGGLNPTQLDYFHAILIPRIMYETLVAADGDGNPVPDLAESWTYTDATTIRFSLVKNAIWHDGQPFTVDDVVYTVNLYLAHPELPVTTTLVQSIESVTSIDKYTVELRTRTPDSKLITHSLLGMLILPQHIWENVGDLATFTNEKPVGTGPFEFVKWGGPDTYYEFKANAQYFGGKPKIDRLVVRYFTSYNTMALAIQSGEIDYAGPLFPPAIVPTLTSSQGVQVITRPDLRYFFINMNAYAKGEGNPTLRDKTVRVALAHAVNNTELATLVWSGYAIPLTTTIPASLGYWINPNTPRYDFDLKEAARMLDDAGYKIGSDGIRVSPSGVKMSYTIYIPSDYSQEYRGAQAIANWWKQIGVEAKPQLTDPGSLFDIVVNWKEDMEIWCWSSSFSADPEFYLLPFVTSEAQPAPNGGTSDSGMSNATYDALHKQQIEEVDRDKRRDIVWRMQDILHQEVPYIPLYTPLAVQAFRSDRFTGLEVRSLPPLTEFNANNLFLAVTPTSMSTQTSAATTSVAVPTGMSTESVLAIVLVIAVAASAVAFIAGRRRTRSEKPPL